MKAVGRMDREARQFQVLTNTQIVDPQELENRVVAEKNGQAIRVRDLGRVIITHEDRTMAIRQDFDGRGSDAVVLTVFRRLGGNALTVSSELNRMLETARPSATAKGIHIVPVYDQALLVRTAIDNVRDAILIGGLFSVLILLMFLKSIRATLLAAISIPLSLTISFFFLRLTGDTLNLMSLGGLAVAIGLIIDDSVVVVENIARHMAEGQTGDDAIAAASREISGAVIGSTLTTILVFVPLAFVRGVIGQFFQSLSLALSVALLVSMVISLTLVPVLAARFLGRRRMPHSGPDLQRPGRRLRRAAAGGAADAADRHRPGASGRRAGLVALPERRQRLHARNGRRGLRPGLRDAGRHFPPADRRRAAAGRGLVAGYARHQRLHPPHGGRTRLLRHRAAHGRHPGEPQAVGPTEAHRRGNPRGSAPAVDGNRSPN